MVAENTIGRPLESNSDIGTGCDAGALYAVVPAAVPGPVRDTGMGWESGPTREIGTGCDRP